MAFLILAYQASFPNSFLHRSFRFRTFFSFWEKFQGIISFKISVIQRVLWIWDSALVRFERMDWHAGGCVG